jgi:hypothetical protein
VSNSCGQITYQQQAERARSALTLLGFAHERERADDDGRGLPCSTRIEIDRMALVLTEALEILYPQWFGTPPPLRENYDATDLRAIYGG